MTTKLNITIQEDTVQRIKKYAKVKKTSVSKIIEEQLNFFLNSTNKKEKESISIVERHQAILAKYATKEKNKFKNIDALREEQLKSKYGL